MIPTNTGRKCYVYKTGARETCDITDVSIPLNGDFPTRTSTFFLMALHGALKFVAVSLPRATTFSRNLGFNYRGAYASGDSRCIVLGD